jgi:hypothetical protein
VYLILDTQLAPCPFSSAPVNIEPEEGFSWDEKKALSLMMWHI